jgi:4-hydroxythreonine-4-phosphate dehydrogenase
MATLLAFADDLSGAAETAAALRMRAPRNTAVGTACAVALVLSTAGTGTEGAGTDGTGTEGTGTEGTGTDFTADPLPEGVDAIVIDTDTRSLDVQDAERRTREIVRRVVARHPGAHVVKKIDSLLRGHIAAELAPFIDLDQDPGIVLCPALPVMGRTVVDGAVTVTGAPLADVDAWRRPTPSTPGAARATAPTTIADAIAPLTASEISLATVRSTPATLATAIATAIARRHVVVCDAETDDDLAQIVRAAWDLDGPPAVLAGSSALAGAAGEWMRQPKRAGERRPARQQAYQHREVSTTDAALVVVAGTAEPGIRRQLARIAEHGAKVLTVTPLQLLDAPESVAQSIARHVAGEACVAVTIESAPVPDTVPTDGRTLSRALARAVADGCGDADLVLTGGETARRVLDALGIESLSLGEPVMRTRGEESRTGDQCGTEAISTEETGAEETGTEEHGAVRLHTPDGRVIVTRPGSFGDDDSLLTIIRAVRPGSFRSIRQSKGTS